MKKKKNLNLFSNSRQFLFEALNARAAVWLSNSRNDWRDITTFYLFEKQNQFLILKTKKHEDVWSEGASLDVVFLLLFFFKFYLLFFSLNMAVDFSSFYFFQF